MIISVCGNGYSGSGAVFDLLRENNEIGVPQYDIEFLFLYDVDGIDDLKYHIVDNPVRFFSSDAAIKRYKKYIDNICSPNSKINKLGGKEIRVATEKYLNNITQIDWNGWWQFDVINSMPIKRNVEFRIKPRINKVLSRIGLQPMKILSNNRMFLSIRPEKFDLYTKQYVAELVSMFNPQNRAHTLLNQPFPVGKHKKYRSYFSDKMKTIYVLRDPRDIYIATKEAYKAYGSWIPQSNIDDYIQYYKLLYSIDYNAIDVDEEMVVHFEDLVLNYENTVDQIYHFLDITTQRNKQFFNPDISKANVGLFYRYNQYDNDIKKIEKELYNALYNFTDSNLLKSGGRVF